MGVGQQSREASHRRRSVFLDSDAFVQALASDDGRAAKKHLAAGRAVYYEDPAYSDEGLIKSAH